MIQYSNDKKKHFCMLRDINCIEYLEFLTFRAIL